MGGACVSEVRTLHHDTGSVQKGAGAGVLFEAHCMEKTPSHGLFDSRIVIPWSPLAVMQKDCLVVCLIALNNFCLEAF